MSEIVKQYELAPLPTQGGKSFYHKALVRQLDNGNEVLLSYGTPVVVRSDGKLFRLWNDWSATTQKHVKAFCGLNKAGYLALPFAKEVIA